MSRVPTEQLRDGMIVQSDVQNLHGQTLFRSGTTLTDKLIERLETWGVVDVDVELDEADKAREEELLQEIEQELPKIEDLFRWSDQKASSTRQLILLGAERLVRKRKSKEAANHG